MLRWRLFCGVLLVEYLYSVFSWCSLCLCLFCGFAVITGSHKGAVASAVTRVEVLIESFRRKQPFTHFLSFALNHPQIQEGFKCFKEEVLDQCSQVGSWLHFAEMSNFLTVPLKKIHGKYSLIK